MEQPINESEEKYIRPKPTDAQRAELIEHINRADIEPRVAPSTQQIADYMQAEQECTSVEPRVVREAREFAGDWPDCPASESVRQLIERERALTAAVEAVLYRRNLDQWLGVENQARAALALHAD